MRFVVASVALLVVCSAALAQQTSQTPSEPQFFSIAPDTGPRFMKPVPNLANKPKIAAYCVDARRPDNALRGSGVTVSPGGVTDSCVKLPEYAGVVNIFCEASSDNHPEPYQRCSGLNSTTPCGGVSWLAREFGYIDVFGEYACVRVRNQERASAGNPAEHKYFQIYLAPNETR